MDLNVALILRLVDQVSGPARQIAAALGGIGEGWAEQGSAALGWNRQATEAHEARVNALRMEAAETAALGFAAVRFLAPAVQFEDQMARVGAIAGASSAELAAMAATARDLGASTAWSARESAEGMENLASAGFAAGEIVAAMPGLLALASAGGEGLAVSTDIAASTLRGFGLDAAQMGRVADVLTNAAAGTNAQVGDLGETLKYVAPIARNAGVSLELASAMAGALANNGIRGSMAGTGLAAILQRLQAPAQGASHVLEALGVSVLDGQGNMRDAISVLRDLDAAMAGMGSGQRAEIITTLVGAEASAELQVLLDAAGSGELSSLAEQMTGVGSALQMAARVEATAGGGLREFSGAFEEFQIAVGAALLPLLVEMLSVVTPLVRDMGQWAAENPQLVSTLGQIAAGLIGLKVAGLVAGAAVSTVTGTVLGLHRGIAAIATGIGWLRTGIGAVVAFSQGVAVAVAAFGGWGGAFAALGALLTGPVGIAIAVVAGLAAAAWLVVRNWGRVGPFLAEVWAGVVRVAQGAWTVIRALFMTFSPLGWIIPNWSGITRWVSAIWTGLIGTTQAAMSTLGAAVASWTPEWLMAAWSGLGRVFQSVWAGVQSGAAALWSSLGAGFAGLWALIERAGSGDFNLFGLLAGAVAGFDWAALVPAVDWAGLVATLDWRLFVPGISWMSLLNGLGWETLVTPIRWPAFLARIDWRLFVPGIGWTGLLERLNWRALIPAINWRSLLPASWAGLLPRWNWAAVIPRVSLAGFISMPGAGPVGRPGAGPGAPPAPRPPGPPALQRRASGGAFGPGPLLVGEAGPELYYPDAAGWIAHHGQLRTLAGLSAQVLTAQTPDRGPAIRLLPTGRSALREAGRADDSTAGSRGRAAAAPMTFTGDWHFHTQPGQDPRDIAEAVMAEIDARAAQARRAALHDREDTADG